MNEKKKQSYREFASNEENRHCHPEVVISSDLAPASSLPGHVQHRIGPRRVPCPPIPSRCWRTRASWSWSLRARGARRSSCESEHAASCYPKWMKDKENDILFFWSVFSSSTINMNEKIIKHKFKTQVWERDVPPSNEIDGKNLAFT